MLRFNNGGAVEELLLSFVMVGNRINGTESGKRGKER